MQRIADGAGPSLEGTKAEAVAWAMWGHWMPLRGFEKNLRLVTSKTWGISLTDEGVTIGSWFQTLGDRL